MRQPPLILVVDDMPDNVEIVRLRLESENYNVITAVDGEDALAQTQQFLPDLILLDIMMPKLDGIEVVKRLKANAALPFIPIILLTAKADVRDVVAGLEVGADDYLTKPVEHSALIARVRAMLRIKALHDQTQQQAAELSEWNLRLEERVQNQLGELERLGKLKRFLSHQVAEIIVSSNSDALLASHRREITVVFCDLRGFTAFSEVAEPEDVMSVLASYHSAAGALIERYEATLERFTGDGLMLFFNDPLPCPNPAERAVRLAMDLRDNVNELADRWRSKGHDLGFGVGIALGFATLGRVGFEQRGDYSAIGTVVNQASRLCDHAKAGEILISQRVKLAVEHVAQTEPVGELSFKGLRQALSTHRLASLK